jgi:hypothetical protein
MFQLRKMRLSEVKELELTCVLNRGSDPGLSNSGVQCSVCFRHRTNSCRGNDLGLVGVSAAG